MFSYTCKPRTWMLALVLVLVMGFSVAVDQRRVARTPHGPLSPVCRSSPLFCIFLCLSTSPTQSYNSTAQQTDPADVCGITQTFQYPQLNPLSSKSKMLFFSFFKTLVEHEITVELKNEVQIRGTLKSVDQYLNIKLDNAEAVDELRWPHLCSTKDMFIRGSVVRYVHLPSGAVDTALLEDATRREAEAAKNKAK